MLSIAYKKNGPARPFPDLLAKVAIHLDYTDKVLVASGHPVYSKFNNGFMILHTIVVVSISPPF
jgi:hypothetical protein